MQSEHECYHRLGMDPLVTCYRMLWEHERYCGLRMDALDIGCTRNTNAIMVWAWMLWLSDAVGTRMLSSFGHGSSGYLLPYALGTRTLLWFTHGCSGYWMHSEHGRFYGLGMDALVIGRTENASVKTVLGMDALVIGCAQNTNVIMAWAEGLRGSGCLRPTVRYYPPIPPPNPPRRSSETKQNRVRKSPRLHKL